MSLRPEPRADRRKKGFKKGIDPEDARRKREDNIIELRKSKRDESLQKKRAVSSMGGAAGYMEDSTRQGVGGQKVGVLRYCTLLIFFVCEALTCHC
jgi:Importin beta binding domain